MGSTRLNGPRVVAPESPTTHRERRWRPPRHEWRPTFSLCHVTTGVRAVTQSLVPRLAVLVDRRLRAKRLHDSVFCSQRLELGSVVQLSSMGLEYRIDPPRTTRSRRTPVSDRRYQPVESAYAHPLAVRT